MFMKEIIELFWLIEEGKEISIAVECVFNLVQECYSHRYLKRRNSSFFKIQKLARNVLKFFEIEPEYEISTHFKKSEGSVTFSFSEISKIWLSLRKNVLWSAANRNTVNLRYKFNTSSSRIYNEVTLYVLKGLQLQSDKNTLDAFRRKT